MLNVGIVQMLAKPLQVGENLALAERSIDRAVEGGAQLVVLPEMFNVGFYFGEELMTVAEDLEGRTVDWLKAQAARHDIYITGSLYERFEGYFYNTMFMTGSDGSLQYYRKRNPTCQERTVWRRSDEPGPGIFDTPFGRVGGVICFDSFSRETFEGFKRSGVELVVIVALWGTLRPVALHPETRLFHHLLKRWSHLASEVVPHQYATMLDVPAVFVNQAGTFQSPFPRPPFWPFPSRQDITYDFWGSSNARNASGEVLSRAGSDETDFVGVVPLDVRQQDERPEVSRVNIPPQYLNPNYYFVQPPFQAKLFQEWCSKGFVEEYDARCSRQRSP
jgi:N-carbamoylputrescine amidase